MADFEVTFVTDVCLQYIIIGIASILISRKHRRRMQTVFCQTVDPDAQCVWSIHPLFQQLLMTDVPLQDELLC